MNTPRKRGGRKRSRTGKPSLKCSVQIEPTNFDVLQFAPLVPATPIPQPEKSFSEVLAELAWEVYKHLWKQSDPGSYNANQAMFALAPYWPPEGRWMLGVGAVGTAIYGFGKVSDRFEKAIERERKQRVARR